MVSSVKASLLTNLILFMLGFTAGLGIAYWEKVEIINIGFYLLALGGVLWLGIEVLQGVRAYRQAMAQRLKNANMIFAHQVRLPSLPQLEILKIEAEFMQAVEDTVEAEL